MRACKVWVYLSADEKKLLQREAVEQNTSVSDLIARLLFIRGLADVSGFYDKAERMKKRQIKKELAKLDRANKQDK